MTPMTPIAEETKTYEEVKTKEIHHYVSGKLGK